MIDIVIYKEPECRLVFIGVSGHANTAKKGQDTICAAVSILVYGLAAQIEKLDEKYFANRHVEIGDEGTGIADIMAEGANTAVYMRVLDYLEPIERAMESLAEKYPQQVRLTTKGSRPKNLGPEWLRLWDIE